MDLVRLVHRMGAVGLKRRCFPPLSQFEVGCSKVGPKKCRVSARGFSVSAAIAGEEKQATRRPKKSPPLSSAEIASAQDNAAGKKSTDTSHISKSRFDEFEVHPNTVKAIKDVLGYEHMTVVQEATLPLILKGEDVLAKARTGTGKTIAFLLPTIETILKVVKQSSAYHDNPIRALVICPTRELAMQASKEAQILLKFHHGLGSQIAIGGNNSIMEAKKIKLQPCQILVGTPGRLLDHIENAKGFADQLKSVKVLVLDEADTLLDMGFRQSLTKILNYLPKKRQTLLFSATIPDEVHKISQLALKPDHKFVDTVGEETETHEVVEQKYLVVQQDTQIATLYTLLKNHIAEEPNYKVLVFCITANITAYMAAVFTKLGFNTREIHSRKNQAYRTRVSDEFRKSKGLIMFTSDVSARGIDYPDVTLVLQVGIPPAREQYIHRLGRTGRAGKDGQGILLLLPWEESFIRQLHDISIRKMEAPKVLDLTRKIKPTLMEVEDTTKTKAFQSWLGYYTTTKSVTVDKHTVVDHSFKFCQSMGLQKPPHLDKSTIKKMGLGGIL